MRFSLKYKFLLVTTLLMVFCVGVYFWIATRSFKADKVAFVIDYNKSLAENVSAEVESFFTGISDKLRLGAHFYRNPRGRDRQVIQDLLAESSDIIFLAGSDDFQKLGREFYRRGEFQEAYGLSKSYFASELSVPFEDLRQSGEVLWNATTENGPPLIGYAKSVVEEDSRGQPVGQFAMVAFIKVDALHKRISLGSLENKLAKIFITNGKGELLVHPQTKFLKTDIGEFKKQELVRAAIDQSDRIRAFEYREKDQAMLGAYAKAYGKKLFVFSSTRVDKAFRAVDSLVRQSLIFASLVVTLAFIVAILFSRTLTRPIDRLMGGMKKVSQGNLETKIQVSSGDEIASLANSFNEMIRDLKHSREELEAINRELEDKVKERTKRLEEQNLAVKEAQEALLKSTRLAAVGEIAGQAAHEVLNPLTTILNRAQKIHTNLNEKILGETNLLDEIRGAWSEDYQQGGFKKLVESWQSPSDVKKGATLWEEDLENLGGIGTGLKKEIRELLEDADFVLQEGQRINRIVNSMRSMSTAKSELEAKALSEMAERAIKIMGDMAMKDDIELVCVKQTETDLCLIDEDEFIQVLTNLIRNSIQSVNLAKPDKPRVAITVSSDEQSVFLRVSDNGEGISLENQEKIFRTRFSTKSKREGTGIGLNISRRLVRAFQGELELEKSVPGEGASFLIRLPLLENQSGRASA